MPKTESRFVSQFQEVETFSPQAYLEYDGIDLLHGMIAGQHLPPPMARLMNFCLCEASQGRAQFRGAPLYDHYNPAGVVHGG